MTPRAVRAEVDCDAMAGNLCSIKRIVGPGVKICAVVKADGYGHGAVQAARAFLGAGADFLAVAILEEALELRGAGIAAPLLVLGHTDPSNAAEIIANGISQTVFAEPLAKALSDAAVRAGKPARVHLKVDTGMNRLGVRFDAAADFAALLAHLPGLEIEGTFSHFADADDPASGFARIQLDRFTGAVAEMRARGIDPGILHMANSAAILDVPEARLDMVRPGILLYGLSPLGSHAVPEGFSPAMRLVAGIVLLKDIGDGETVSYGRKYRAEGTRRIATLPIGYADGYPRALAGKASVLVRGARAPVAGRICMDQCMVDVTGIPGVAEGDEAVLFGVPGLPAGELAGFMDTIDYEVTCNVKKRVPRAYRGKDGA